ncbi:MAG: hypothetical protein GX589_05000, partial [Deltaproteobacteria bacterium]|nr:hypothetical protein [Deltaproteobacteria bacterium]
MKENQFLLFLKATGQTYLRCAAKATQGLRRNWTLIIAALAAYLLVILASKLLAPWGFAGGIMLGLISIMLLSMYFGWIVETVQGRRLSWQDFVRFEMGLFSDTLSVAFLLFIITWPFQI